MLCIAAPFLLAACVAIKFYSPGPAIFRQRRVGRYGKPFQMLKLRTMHDGAEEAKRALMPINEADGLFKIADDPRFHPLGRFLRRSCLDELPQLINVLKGEMSLVGPRPLVPEENRRVGDASRIRLAVRPGITGPWQVAGGARLPLQTMVAMDCEYVLNQSLGRDLRLLVRTLGYAIRMRGL